MSDQSTGRIEFAAAIPVEKVVTRDGEEVICRVDATSPEAVNKLLGAMRESGIDAEMVDPRSIRGRTFTIPEPQGKHGNTYDNIFGHEDFNARLN